MYPYMEACDEVALWEANEKYGALFDKYFPELTTLETLLPPELEDYPLMGTVCLRHAIMNCEEKRRSMK